MDQFQIPKEQYINEAVEGLIDDAQQLVQSIQSDAVKDTALIGAIQKIEHYCIAAWGTAAALSRTLGRQPAAQAFEQALDQGKKFDQDMTDLAENQINPAAAKPH
ncbi:MAG: DUF892 family protein [Rhodospirillaceae bacterium]|nr:DUF892 family protein [Rhodospirillales bacterium]